MDVKPEKDGHSHGCFSASVEVHERAETQQEEEQGEEKEKQEEEQEDLEAGLQQQFVAVCSNCQDLSGFSRSWSGL